MKLLNKNNIIGLFLVFAAFVAIVSIFWYKDAQYAIATEKPANFKEVPLNSVIDLEGNLALTDKPNYFHFFQPTCPCSRFNLKHYEALHRKYKDDFNFYCVIPPNADVEWVNDLVDIEVKILRDENKILASACGVYSTPQAAVINTTGELYYRGNYNKGRYCTSKNSNYAEMALEALKQGRQLPEMGHFALTSYGCEYNKTN